MHCIMAAAILRTSCCRFGIEGTLLLRDIVEDNFEHLLVGSAQAQKQIEDIVDFDAHSHAVTIRDNDTKKVIHCCSSY
jgi:hypothetical protein